MQNRPVYLNLLQFAFPITAIISILHRLSGVLLLFLIPVFLGILQDTLYYPWVDTFTNRLIIWLALTAVIYHLLAGIRHLFMDAGMGEDKRIATISSYVVLACTVLLSGLAGWHLC